MDADQALLAVASHAEACASWRPAGAGRPSQSHAHGARDWLLVELAAIARAFLVQEATMAKRLVRDRQKIAHAQIPYRVPTDAELPERLPCSPWCI